MERNENPIEFLKSFTEFSGISEPSTLEEFAETRQYYDGFGMYKAVPLDLNEAAEWVDQKERALEAQPTLLEFDKDLQLEFKLENAPEQPALPANTEPTAESEATPAPATTEPPQAISELAPASIETDSGSALNQSVNLVK